MVPGWPYSIVAALETGRTSGTAVLDAVRLEPGADIAAVTAVQVREVVEQLVAAGQWKPGDPEVLIVLDAGYDAPRIAHLLSDLPVKILGRLSSDRVMRRPTPPRVYDPKGGRLPKHGEEFVFGDRATWGTEQAVTVTDTRLYGKATAQAWDRLHPRLTRRAAWIDHDGPLPIIEGTVIRLVVEKLPSGGVNKPVWLWWSGTGATTDDVDRCWQSFLRRFDLEHTFRLFKQTLGWTKPRLRSPEAADRWTWLVIAVYAQLRLARPLAADLRRPWEKPAEPNRLTPARVRGGSGTSVRRRAPQPVHPNRRVPVSGGHPAQRTAARPSVTMWAGPSPLARPTLARPTTREGRSLGELHKAAAQSIGETSAGFLLGRMSHMAMDKDAAFTLPRGATGFVQPKDGPLPETDQRTFRAALYAAARAARGQVGEIEEQTYPRTFHTATVIAGTGECVILCHAYHPWIAFAQERRDWYTEEFLAPPPWAHTFADLGFVVLGRGQLTLPLSDIDTSVLTQGEWREVRFYGITTLGGVLFNAWD
jgi:hypothetical protein